MSLPEQLRAHRARPVPWLLAGTAFSVLMAAVGLHAAAADRAWVDVARRVEAEVAPGYRGGGEIPVVYRHPVTDQEVEVVVSPWSAGFGSEPGDTLALDVDVDDPERVAVAGDRVPWVDWAFVLPWAAVPLVAYLWRRWAVWRTVRLVERTDTTYAMLGAIAPATRFRGRRPVLHLYPLDAAPGAPSQCSVRVVATAGCPLAGQAFPVEVKGIPRPLGRVVARVGTGDGILWPAGRAAPHSPWPRPAHVGEPVPPTPADAPVLADPQPRWWRGPAEALLLPLGVFGATVLLGAVVTVATLVNADAYRRPVAWRDDVGEVVDRDMDAYTVEVAFGEGRTAQAPVEFAEDYTVGRRYPIEVDPDDPRHVRISREVYDTAEPIVWGWLPVAVAAAVLVVHAARWRRVRRSAREGPFWRMSAWKVPGGDVHVGDRSAGYVRARLPWGKPVESSLPVAVVVAGCPEPGEVVMLFDDAGHWHPVVHRMQVPRRDLPARLHW